VPYSELLRGRASIGGQIYLVTTATLDRAPLFTNLYVGRIVVRTLHSQEIVVDATTLAYVVMPDHLHWLVRLHSGRKLSQVVQLVKGKSAFQINCARGIRSSVWQQSFHDRAVRREENLGDVARYVVCNPLRAGLVRRLNEYALWDAVWAYPESG
jgi:REP element-mobilizing transposase RayT